MAYICMLMNSFDLRYEDVTCVIIIICYGKVKKVI